MSEPCYQIVYFIINAISAIDKEDFKNSGLNKGPPRGQGSFKVHLAYVTSFWRRREFTKR
jgi:hypothetical protein